MKSNIQIKRIYDSKIKKEYIEVCDSAFTISVINRENFSELFSKIDKFAIFIGLDYDGQKAGYAAIYANDIITNIAFITLIVIGEEYQRLHLGTQLLSECFEYAKNAGMRTIKLEVLKCDVGSIRFYETNHFLFDSEASEESNFMTREL